ncbi:MAG: aminoacyl-tRNA hydrolase [candidate division WOR-3 bacterium]
MRLILFTLGNPGKKYTQTRHNIGFMVADGLAEKFNARFKNANDYQHLKVTLGEKELVVVKPLLYMNNSGVVVKEYITETDGDFMVVCDDFALPFGKIRIRERGSDGGHQGLASIIYHLQTNNFPRLRIGIGNPPPEIPHREYVLTKFTREERKLLPKIIELSCEALLYILDNGIKKAMTIYNAQTIS